MSAVADSARVVLLIVALVALGAGVAAWWLSSPAEVPRRPDFVLMDLDGKPRAISEWDGKLVLINFWAPWCQPCREEMPMLMQLQRDLGARGLQVLGPALDEPAAVKPFAAALGINYPVFADLAPTLALQAQLGDTRLPYSVLIDRQGRIVYRRAGLMTRAEIEPELEKHL